jgi:HSP20 family protein
MERRILLYFHPPFSVRRSFGIHLVAIKCRKLIWQPDLQEITTMTGLTISDRNYFLLNLQKRLMSLFHADYRNNDNLDRINSANSSIEIFESCYGIELYIETPEKDFEDLKIIVKDNLLTIQAERKIENESNRYGYYYGDNCHEKYLYNFVIPEEIDIDSIKAFYKGKILYLWLAKNMD